MRVVFWTHLYGPCSFSKIYSLLLGTNLAPHTIFNVKFTTYSNTKCHFIENPPHLTNATQGSFVSGNMNRKMFQMTWTEDVSDDLNRKNMFVSDTWTEFIVFQVTWTEKCFRWLEQNMFQMTRTEFVLFMLHLSFSELYTFILSLCWSPCCFFLLEVTQTEINNGNSQ